MSARLPLTVIGGFLGAGKTTLLNHWLREAGGRRIAVLVNDFGAINVDAALVEAASGDTIALTNGCVCCQIGDDLSRALIQVLDSATRFDAVVVEASGVSDPWRIAQLGRADPQLVLEGVVVLVDASAVMAQARDPHLADTLVRQLRAADLLVLNKTDLAAPDELARARDWLRETAGDTPQLDTAQARVPIALLDSLVPAPAALRAEACGADREHEHEHHHHHGAVFDTWSCRPAQVFARDALRAWLARPPPGLLRLKGWVRTGAAEWSELQFAGRHGAVRSAQAPAGGAAVVAIGLRGQLPAAALAAYFEQP